MRLFIAINLPANIRRELAHVSSFFEHPSVRWVPERNLHITLHFIGQTPLSDIPQLMQEISAIASRASPFMMSFENLRVIRKNRKPVMIWASLKEEKKYLQIAKNLKEALQGDSSKASLAHVTLARIKGRFGNIPPLPQLKRLAFSVSHIDLMESIHRNPAPVYHSMKTFYLGR